MVSAKSMEVRDNFKDWCVQAAEGEVIQISRPGNNYVYLISHETYEKLTGERRIAAYASYLHGKDKITNLKRLAQIENLPENWNNNGAERISGNIIKTVRKPEVIEQLKAAIDEYLEMEVLEDSINVFQIDSEGGEHQNTIAADGATVKKIVREFYDRAV